MAKIKVLKDNNEIVYPQTVAEAVAISDGSSLEELLSAMEKKILDKQYPIGSVYMSATLSTTESVHDALGGVWESWGAGKVPVGVNISDTEFATVEKTGGSKTMTISSANLPTHTHTYNKSSSSTGQNNNNTGAASGNTGAATGNTGITALTVDQIPKHKHQVANQSGVTYGVPQGNYYNLIGYSSGNYTHEAGGGQGHTHTLNSHTHTLNSHTHTLNNHSHTISTTSTNSGNGGFSNTATNNLQPYITCYMYKRVA